MLRPKSLKALIETLRAEGVCRYWWKTPKGEGELELSQHAPAPRAAAEAPTPRPTEALRREQAIPEPLRNLVSPEEFHQAVVNARRINGAE